MPVYTEMYLNPSAHSENLPINKCLQETNVYKSEQNLVTTAPDNTPVSTSQSDIYLLSTSSLFKLKFHLSESDLKSRSCSDKSTLSSSDWDINSPLETGAVISRDNVSRLGFHPEDAEGMADGNDGESELGMRSEGKLNLIGHPEMNGDQEQQGSDESLTALRSFGGSNEFGLAYTEEGGPEEKTVVDFPVLVQSQETESKEFKLDHQEVHRRPKRTTFKKRRVLKKRPEKREKYSGPIDQLCRAVERKTEDKGERTVQGAPNMFTEPSDYLLDNSDKEENEPTILNGFNWDLEEVIAWALPVALSVLTLWVLSKKKAEM